MASQISDIEIKVLTVLQEGFAGGRYPYKDMAERAGMDTEKFLAVLQDWKEQGKIRRIGAIVNHIKLGLLGGAIVAWQVEPERIEEVGNILAGFKEVSHAYERQTAENWPYNIYTMVHGADNREVEHTVEKMSRACGISTYKILVTEKELKKAPPTYITRNR